MRLAQDHNLLNLLQEFVKLTTITSLTIVSHVASCGYSFLRLFSKKGIFSPHSLHVSDKVPLHCSPSNMTDLKT